MPVLRLSDRQEAMLRRYGAGTEQEWFQAGRNALTAHALCRHGLLFVTEQRPEIDGPTEGWKRYELTIAGRAVLDRLNHAAKSAEGDKTDG